MNLFKPENHPKIYDYAATSGWHSSKINDYIQLLHVESPDTVKLFRQLDRGHLSELDTLNPVFMSREIIDAENIP